MSAVLVVGVAALLTGAALWFFFGPLRTEEEPQRRARQEGRHAYDQNCAHLQPPPIGIWSAAVRSRSSRTTSGSRPTRRVLKLRSVTVKPASVTAVTSASGATSWSLRGRSSQR